MLYSHGLSVQGAYGGIALSASGRTVALAYGMHRRQQSLKEIKLEGTKQTWEVIWSGNFGRIGGRKKPSR